MKRFIHFPSLKTACAAFAIAAAISSHSTNAAAQEADGVFETVATVESPDEEGPVEEVDVSTGTDASTRRSFTPQDFDRFAPRSALDMARQVPGFSIREGDGARGLGQADTNVLVNGRRISGKSNGPVEALQRIPTEEVVRLELVDGASLDIGGLTGQVLNVITSSGGGISGQFRYNPQFRSFGTPFRWGDGAISIAGGGSKTDWTLEFESDQNFFNNGGPEQVFDGAGALIDQRFEDRDLNLNRPSLSGSFTRVAGNGNVLNLTGEVQGFFRRELEVSERSGSISPVDRVREFTRTEDEFNFEVGADYQFELGAGRLKVIGYHRYEDSPTTAEARTIFADASADQGSRFERDADEAETIARVEYSTNGLGGDLLFAAEGVRNFLDITSSFEERDASGELVPVALEGATARVDEDRAELQVTYSRALAPNLQFQASASGEYSRISQSGPLGQTRTFYRPKGFVSFDWRAAENVNIAARLERVVGQLNFFDFIASVDLNQDRADVTNADLVPPQSWVVEVEGNIGLGSAGTVNIRPFFERLSDVVDQVPIPGGGQAPGNLPSADFYGVETVLTLLSEGFGWRGTRFDGELLLTDSSITDPLLGDSRRISGNTLVNFEGELRHDIQGSQIAVGSTFDWRKFSENVRLDEISLEAQSTGFAGAYIEHKDIGGLTVRVSVRNLLNRKETFDRIVFIDRIAGLVDFSETRTRRFGTIFTFNIEGSF
ncbi:MAG: TonB-dependent receptor plug domain-containing protein [Pseudomonadota bacterium]|nr:TonB-dependent receptor plug domain-containing protein [Pseudomonadota bacterium]